MWDLPRPGLEPVSPASAGRLSTTAPPEKPPIILYSGKVFKEPSFDFCFHQLYIYVKYEIYMKGYIKSIYRSLYMEMEF